MSHFGSRGAAAMAWTPPSSKQISPLPKKGALRLIDISTAAPDGTSPARSSPPSFSSSTKLYLNHMVESQPPIWGDEAFTDETTYKQRRNKRRKERRRNEKQEQKLKWERRFVTTQLGQRAACRTRSRGCLLTILRTETWGKAHSGHLLNKPGAPFGHSQIGKQS